MVLYVLFYQENQVSNSHCFFIISWKYYYCNYNFFSLKWKILWKRSKEYIYNSPWRFIIYLDPKEIGKWFLMPHDISWIVSSKQLVSILWTTSYEIPQCNNLVRVSQENCKKKINLENLGLRNSCYFKNKDTGMEIKIEVCKSNYLKLTNVKGASWRS